MVTSKLIISAERLVCPFCKERSVVGLSNGNFICLECKDEFNIRELDVKSDSICPNCHFPLNDNWNFCPQCGNTEKDAFIGGFKIGAGT
jgi:hypothetical protein